MLVHFFKQRRCPSPLQIISSRILCFPSLSAFDTSCVMNLSHLILEHIYRCITVKQRDRRVTFTHQTLNTILMRVPTSSLIKCVALRFSSSADELFRGIELYCIACGVLSRRLHIMERKCRRRALELIRLLVWRERGVRCALYCTDTDRRRAEEEKSICFSSLLRSHAGRVCKTRGSLRSGGSLRGPKKLFMGANASNTHLKCFKLYNHTGAFAP